MIKTLLRLLFVIAILQIFFSCTKVKVQPNAAHGILDLRDWDFEKDGPVSLNGQWTFYWEKLLNSQDFQKETRPDMTGFFEMDKFWNGYRVGEKEIGGDGFATFRLNIEFSKPTANLSLKITPIETAYSLFANGELIASCGKVGKSREEMEPNTQMRITDLPSNISKLELILHVSNYYKDKAGPRASLLLGDKNDIQDNKEKSIATDLFLFGSIFIISLYHVGFFILRQNDKSTIYFAGFCFFVALRQFTTNNIYILNILPDLPYQILAKLDYIEFYLGLPFFVSFIHSIFQAEFSSKLLYTIQVLGFIFFLFVISTPVEIFSYSAIFFQVVALFYFLYIIYVLITALIHRREGALILIFGFLIIFSAFINDLLYSYGKISTGYIAHFALFIFIFLQAFLISLRFSKAFAQVEDLSENLEKKVDQRTKELDVAHKEVIRQKQQTETLNILLSKNLKVIRDDLKVAQKIQRHSLLISPAILKELEIKAKYLPQSEVGGDIYVISKLNDTTFRIFLADATGHGIQAALMTMAIKAIYDNAKNWELDLGNIMAIINNEFRAKYFSLNNFMTAILIDINIENQKLVYVSAGHPSAVLIHEDNYSLLSKTGRMIGLSENSNYQSIEMAFNRGDSLYLFTDGIFEEFNEQREEFGEERLHSSLMKNRNLPIDEIFQEILNELNQFLKEGEKQDDITVIGIRYL